MSKLVTFEQAKKLITFEQALLLKRIGYDLGVYYFYNYDPENLEVSKEYVDHIQGWNRLYNHNEILYGQVFPHKCSAPTIHEALGWFREVKGIECEVSMSLDVNISAGEAELIGYGYVIYDTKSKKISYSGTFASRKVSESALLDALIEYVSK